MATTVLWLRRDLRRDDLPALRAAHEAAGAGAVVPLFVVDPVLVASAGAPRLAALGQAVAEVAAEYEGALVLRVGDPATVLPQVVAESGAASIHVSGESTPYGRVRGGRVRRALADRCPGVVLHATGTPYAVSPGRLRTGEGTPYQVFTPFARAWRRHGWEAPQPAPRGLRFARGLDSAGLAALPTAVTTRLGGTAAQPPGGTAVQRWAAFLEGGLAGYAEARDRPDLAGTSRMSEPLKYGRIHPRRLLADIAAHPAGQGEGAHRFVTELAWREFYADVLWHHPGSAWRDLRGSLAGMVYDDPGVDAVAAGRLTAWQEGRTGYPIVDAGMRQLSAEGWLPNRVRMITASFLCKDLHLWWPHGARHFLNLLRDGDIASNSHGWQWVAGTGTDAAPYFRVFNPVSQGQRYDPDGAYVRAHVPELAHLAGRGVHTPWAAPEGYAHGYPPRVVDHDAERAEALARYAAARGAGGGGEPGDGRGVGGGPV